MPLLKPLDNTRFSGRGPVPRPLNVGPGLAVMLLCLQDGQELIAPEDDRTETVFTVLDGEGFITDGEETHAVSSGDVVHVLPDSAKVLKAGDGTFAVLGIRRLKGKQ